MNLYIHIPFCQRVCPYCAFFKHTPAATDIHAFVQALVIEARMRLPEGFAPTTIYMGGGTPSMLSPTLMARLAEGLTRPREEGGAGIKLDKLKEWTLEANPATFNHSKANLWRQLGVTRVSLGIQSFDKDLLQLLGRTHTPQQARDSVRILREVGMPQVSIDLMFSLPQQTVKHWQQSLEESLLCQPNHISTYSLTLEKGTAFHRQFGAIDITQDTEYYQSAHQILTTAGYRHYEVSNYAIAESRCLHNLAVWRGEDYYGIGPSACGTTHNERIENKGDTMTYIQALVEKEELPPRYVEQLTEEQRRIEFIGLGLRTDEGIESSLLDAEGKTLFTHLEEEKLAIYNIETQRVALTPAGMLLADEVAVNVM